MTFTISKGLRDREYDKFSAVQIGSKIATNVNILHEPFSSFINVCFKSGTADTLILGCPNVNESHRVWGWMLNVQPDAAGEVDIFLSGAGVLGSHATVMKGWNNQFTGINQTIPIVVPYNIGSPYATYINSNTAGTGCVVVLYDDYTL